MQRKTLLYDKGGEEHFNLISALHKSMRSSDLTRRSTGWRGCSKPARTGCTSRAGWCGWRSKTSAWPIRGRWSRRWRRKQAVHFLGIPEGDLALAQVAIYLCVAPKSDAAYKALMARCADVQNGIARARADAAAQCSHPAHEGVGLRRRAISTRTTLRKRSRIWSASPSL